MWNRIPPLMSLALLCSSLTAGAADYVWDGENGAHWDDPLNWTANSGYPVSGDRVSFQGTANTTISLHGNQAVRRIVFSDQNAFSINDHTLTLDAWGLLARADVGSPTGQVIVNSAMTLAGAATFRNDCGWTHENSQLSLRGALTGSDTLTIEGAGNGGVELRADNASTFTGPIVVNGGWFLVGHSQALGDVGHGTTLNNGATLVFRGGVNTPENFTVAGNATQSSLSPSTASGTFQVHAGATFTINNGGGNTFNLPGVLSGPGSIVMTSGGCALSGPTPNTLSGLIDHQSNRSSDGLNTLTLNKSGGAAAIAGPLKLSNKAIVKWSQNDQVADPSAIELAGGVLKPDGHSDTLGVLTATGPGEIDLTGGPNTLRFADSRAATWTGGGELLITGWSGSGTDAVFVGASASGLTSTQRGNVAFVDPAGQAPGLYLADQHATGELVPSSNEVVPINPPFDLSEEAMASREAIYTSTGRAELSGTDTPLQAGMKISLFGDSITWQNQYLSRIQNALNTGAGSGGLGVTLYNRGINGGGVLQVRDGSSDNTFDGQPQAGFADVIQADGADVATVFIGINDVWWRGTSEATFRGALEDIADAAAAQGVHLVLATLSVRFEKPDGSNPDDPKIEIFAQITRDVAAAKGVTLVDLRQVFIAYLRNHNWDLHLDGSLSFRQSGILTYDGVHPTSLGNDLVADHIAHGILRALGGDPLFDADLDGMPDTWEQRFFGSPTQAVAGANPDVDGHSNLQEYIADTDPTNAASSFGVRLVSADVAERSIVLPTSTARVYTVQYTTNLPFVGGWTDLGPEAPGTGSELTVTDARPVDRLTCYRGRVAIP